MNYDVTQAVARLQARQMSTSSTWTGDLLDEALDKLLTDPDAVDDVDTLIRKAKTYAHKKLTRRRALLQHHGDDLRASPMSEADPEQICVVGDFLARQPDTVQSLLAAGTDMPFRDAQAKAAGITLQLMRERVSRARKATRQAWGNA
jgi:hypothetical protein